MFPIVIYSDKFLDAISWFMRVGGISIFPFIILSERYRYGDPFRTNATINHESIHFQQALELLVIPFYILYVVEYILKSIIYWDIGKGYSSISFEREAYTNDRNMNYLNTRKRYVWVTRIIK